MNNDTEVIKGQCEMCGFFFKGIMETNNGVFREIKCNKCGNIMENFDSEDEVDDLNESEGDSPVYKKVQLQYVK